MARTNYVNLETGARRPGPATLVRMGSACGVTPQELSGIDLEEATLRDLREWAGLSQAEAAQRAGWQSASTYARIEQGRAELGPTHVDAVAAALGVDPHHLWRARRRIR